MRAMVVVVSLAVVAAAHSPERERPMESAARVLDDQVTGGRTPSIQYRHFTHDSVVFSYDRGLGDVARGTPASDATTYHGFSVTKTATAVAILQLVDRGRIELDAPAAGYLPDFPYAGPITVRQLLSHSAGVPNPLPLRWIHLEAEHSAFEPRPFFDPIFAAHRTPKSSPGRRVRYSNLGYVLLGRMIEEVAGVRYEEYVTANILGPIGLSPDALGFAIDPGRHATGYHRRRSASGVLLRVLIDHRKYVEPGNGRWAAFRPYHVNGAAYGGLIGTADGFTRYVQALLDPGSGLLSDGARRALFEESILADGTRSGMALSWFVGELGGHGYRAHAGGGGGYYAEIRLYPELGRGSVLLLNRSGFSDARFLDRIDRYLLVGEPPASGRAFAG